MSSRLQHQKTHNSVCGCLRIVIRCTLSSYISGSRFRVERKHRYNINFPKVKHSNLSKYLRNKENLQGSEAKSSQFSGNSWSLLDFQGPSLRLYEQQWFLGKGRSWHSELSASYSRSFRVAAFMSHHASYSFGVIQLPLSHLCPCK